MTTTPQHNATITRVMNQLRHAAAADGAWADTLVDYAAAAEEIVGDLHDADIAVISLGTWVVREGPRALIALIDAHMIGGRP